MHIIMKGLLLICLTAVVLIGPLVTQAQKDTVWGVTTGGGSTGNGTLYYMNIDGTNSNVAYNFSYLDGTPLSGLVNYKGTLYGVTGGGANSDGAIFSYNIVSQVYTLLYSLNRSNGNYPTGKLTVDSANGLLYGEAQYGGANYSGVIFSFDPVSGNYTDVYDFPTVGANYPVGPLTLYNGIFYGTASGGANNGGVIFSFNPATNTFTDLYDASNLNPSSNDGSLVAIGNVLYGIGDYGGSNGSGILFSFNLATNVYTDLYDFNPYGSPALANPEGIVTDGTTIYGVTTGQGFTSDWYGTIFSFVPATQALTALHTFSGSGANTPLGNLLYYAGNLLGTSYSGGQGNGEAFSFNPVSKGYTDLQDFGYSSALGVNPENQLLVVHAVGTTPQTIAFSNMTENYGAAPFDPGAVASSGLPVAYSSDNAAVAVINSNNQVQIVGAGTANISANQNGNVTYDSITVTNLLTVNPVPLLITAADTVVNQEQPEPVFQAIYTGLVNGDSAGSLPTPPTLATTATPSSPQGTYPITIGGAVDPNYIISFQSGTLTVVGLLQLLSYTDTSVVYGVADTAAGASSTGLPVTYTSSDTSVAVITSNQQVHIRSVGTTTINVSQAGTSTYAATTTAFVVHVTPAPLTITANDETKVFDQPDPVFTAVYSGFVNGDDTNSLTAPPVFTTTSGPNAPPGVYLIRVSGAADSNYTISFNTGTYILTPVQGDQVNSLNAWFSSSSTLQLGVWMTAPQSAVLQVYDIGGSRVINQQISLGQGYNSLTLPAAALAAGAYIIRVAGNNLTLTQTISKIN